MIVCERRKSLGSSKIGLEVDRTCLFSPNSFLTPPNTEFRSRLALPGTKELARLGRGMHQYEIVLYLFTGRLQRRRIERTERL